MAKRIIDLTDDADASEQTRQRARQPVEIIDAGDGMEVDVGPFTHGSANVGIRPGYRPLPLILSPGIQGYNTNGPTSTSGGSTGTTTTTFRRGLPDHMRGDTMTDEVVLTAVLIFRFFVDFPPELIELLCNWTCLIFEVRETLAAPGSGSFPLTSALVYDPRTPFDLAHISIAHCDDYSPFAQANLASFIPFRNMFSRLCVNIIHLRMAEFELRQMEYEWKKKLDNILRANFPGQKAFITAHPCTIGGASTKLAIPIVRISLSDIYGNSVRPFTFTGFKFPYGTQMVHMKVAGDEVQTVLGETILGPTGKEYDLSAAIQGATGTDTKFEGLVTQRGLEFTKAIVDNSRLTFKIRAVDNDDTDDDIALISFKFVVEGNPQ